MHLTSFLLCPALQRTEPYYVLTAEAYMHAKSKLPVSAWQAHASLHIRRNYAHSFLLSTFGFLFRKRAEASPNRLEHALESILQSYH